MGKGFLSPVCVAGVCKDLLICQAMPRGMAIRFPDHTDQIRQDVGFCLKKNTLPANPAGVCCLRPAWSWGIARQGLVAEHPHGQQQGCIKLRVAGGPPEDPGRLRASRWPSTAHFVVMVQPPGSRRTRKRILSRQMWFRSI